MVVQLTTMKQPPLSKPIFLLDAKEVLAPECGIGRTLPTIPCGHPPASLAPQTGKCTAHTIKSRNNHQVDPLASALCAHFCNYTLLLWKPKTFGSSSTQSLSPFWSQVWLPERKAQLGISYSILCVTTTRPTLCFWRVPETRFLKFSQMGRRWNVLLYLN